MFMIGLVISIKIFIWVLIEPGAILVCFKSYNSNRQMHYKLVHPNKCYEQLHWVQ